MYAKEAARASGHRQPKKPPGRCTSDPGGIRAVGRILPGTGRVTPTGPAGWNQSPSCRQKIRKAVPVGERITPLSPQPPARRPHKYYTLCGSVLQGVVEIKLKGRNNYE